MLFQALDNKRECYKIFCDSALHDDYISEDLTHTWAPTHHFHSQEVEYASLWCNGKSLEEVCPERLKARLQIVTDKAKVFVKTFYNAKINLDDVCFYDLVPEKFLMDYYEVKNQITQHVFENFEKPKNYDFLLNLILFLKDIEGRELSVDKSQVAGLDGSEKLSSNDNKIYYNPWKAVTGRLTTNKNSFPILTLNKELRSAIKPNNDVFLELDYNSAELRVLLGLLGQKQPPEDLHEWIRKNVFDDKLEREKSKIKTFAWLYNPESKNKKLNAFFDRNKILDKFYKNGFVETPYGRKIRCDSDKALNYMIQSTSSDMLLTSALNVAKILQDKKSFVSFCIHDSIVIDLSLEDKALVDDLRNLFSDTLFGKLKTNVSLGKDFGNMRKV